MHGTTKFLIPKNVQIQILNIKYIYYLNHLLWQGNITSILLSIQVLYTNFGTIINNSLNNPDFIVLSP